MASREQALLLGERKSLVGVFTPAIGTTPSSEQMAIVVLNTGIIHRVGHHRMYVTFARALADVGYPVLRFDLSGIGDSENVHDLPPLESALTDIGDALDWLETNKQIRRVILLGLCSGADHAVLYAANDARVVGLVLMDPTVPPTRRYFVHHVGQRVFRIQSWLSVAFGQSRVRQMLIERMIAMVSRKWKPRRTTLVHPEIRSQLEQVYKASVDRGVEFLVVFTSGGYHNYREQLLDAFPTVFPADRLRLEYFVNFDHVFTPERVRAQLLSVILGWMRETDFKHALTDSKGDFGQCLGAEDGAAGVAET
jgi:pimeloyl-ACP methyl ester carboxylesterase